MRISHRFLSEKKKKHVLKIRKKGMQIQIGRITNNAFSI